MPVETSALPDVDPIGAPVAAAPPAASSRLQDWTRSAAAYVAQNPGYVLAAAVGAGFVAGRVVKRLLSSESGGDHERYVRRA